MRSPATKLARLLNLLIDLKVITVEQSVGPAFVMPQCVLLAQLKWREDHPYNGN